MRILQQPCNHRNSFVLKLTRHGTKFMGRDLLWVVTVATMLKTIIFASFDVAYVV